MASMAPKLMRLSSDDTTTLLLQLLHTLASSPEGAHALVEIDDLSPLTEIAPTHSIVLDIISFAWLNSMTAVDDAEAFTSQVDETIQSLASSFTSTDAVTFLEFLGSFLRQANPQVCHDSTSAVNKFTDSYSRFSL